MEKLNPIPLFTNTAGYFFWLMVISLVVFMLERLRPYDKNQPATRPQAGQDLFWLFFNGHYAGLLVFAAFDWVIASLAGSAPDTVAWISDLRSLESVRLLTAWPLWAQFIFFFIVKDFFEWLVHVSLHRVPLFWKFHQLHHSIERLDFLGNFRFHWMEIVLYKSLTYAPLAIFGISFQVVFWVAVVSTLIGHLNHANLPFSYGPLRYVINSPMFHSWHHEYRFNTLASRGKNFAIVLSIWDYIFRTAYYEDRKPERLGFSGDKEFPRSLWRRLLYPLSLLVPETKQTPKD